MTVENVNNWTIDDFQEYFVIDEISGDLFIDSDLVSVLVRARMPSNKIRLLFEIMSFNSDDREKIEVNEENIHRFNNYDDQPFIIRRELQGKRDMLLAALIKRDGYFCRHCGAVDDLTIDHIKPVMKGGKNKLSNLQLLCRSCNSKKGAKLMENN